MRCIYLCCFLFFYVVHLPNLGDLVNSRYHTTLVKTIHAIFHVIYLPNLKDLVNMTYRYDGKNNPHQFFSCSIFTKSWRFGKCTYRCGVYFKKLMLRSSNPYQGCSSHAVFTKGKPVALWYISDYATAKPVYCRASGAIKPRIMSFFCTPAATSSSAIKASVLFC